MIDCKVGKKSKIEYPVAAADSVVAAALGGIIRTYFLEEKTNR